MHVSIGGGTPSSEDSRGSAPIENSGGPGGSAPWGHYENPFHPRYHLASFSETCLKYASNMLPSSTEHAASMPQTCHNMPQACHNRAPGICKHPQNISQTRPKHTPNCPQTVPNMVRTWPKHGQRIVQTHRPSMLQTWSKHGPNMVELLCKHTWSK